MFKRIFSVLIVFALFMSVGCTSGHATSVGEQAEDFTLTSLSGQEVSLSSLRGKKVFIDFFATWCPPCRKELKEIQALVEEFPAGNYEILCVSVDNAVETVKKFIDSKGYSMTVLFDDQGVSRKYGVQGIPALFLVDEKGVLVWSQAGIVSKKEIASLLEINN